MGPLATLLLITCLVPGLDAYFGGYCCDASEIWYKKLSEVDGKPPQCGSNCTYLSSKNSKVMPCSLEACGDLQSVEYEPSPPEFCATTRTDTGICTPDISFVKFYDRGTNEHKIALRVQFSPPDFADIEHITGFRVYITDGIETYSRCYFFNKTMTFNDNIKDIFVNDCFLPAQRKRKPLFDIRISIASLPLKIGSPSSSEKTIVVKVPKRGHGVVERSSYCKNSSIKYSYSVEPGFGRKASIEICKLDQLGDCQPETKKIVQRNLNASGTLYNLTFPKLNDGDSSASYRIFLYGKRHIILNFTDVNFTSCQEEFQSTPFATVLVLAVAIGIIVLIIFLVVVLVWRHRNGNNSPHGEKTESQERLRVIEDSESGSYTASRVDVHVEEEPEILLHERPLQNSAENQQRPLSVFVAYTNDHELHEKAVVSFCAYLRDLGLDVALRLWDRDDENEKYTDNTRTWVINKATSADRVVLICSAGTNHRLGVEQNEDDPEFCEFAAVANQALNKGKSSKFLVCYFNYSSEGCIPEELGKVYISHYKLMDDIKDFYFHLIGKEKYTPRGKHSFNELEPECWRQVQEHVQSMNKYATENPTWYNAHRLDTSETNEPLTTDPKPEDDTKLDDDANNASRADDSEFQFQQKEASNEANPFKSAEDGTAPDFTQPILTEDASGNWNQPTPHETDRLLPHNLDDAEQQSNSRLDVGEIDTPNNIRHDVLAPTNNSDFRRQENELPHERVGSELPCELSPMQNDNRHSDESFEHGSDVAADPDHAREAMEMALEFLHRGPVDTDDVGHLTTVVSEGPYVIDPAHEAMKMALEFLHRGTVDTDDVGHLTTVVSEGPYVIDPTPVGPFHGPVAAEDIDNLPVVRMPACDAMHGSSLSMNETSDTEPVSENTMPKSVEVDENESMVQLRRPRNESHSSRESNVGDEGSANLERVADSVGSVGCENDGDPGSEIGGGVIETNGVGSNSEGSSNASSFFENFCQNWIDSKK